MKITGTFVQPLCGGDIPVMNWRMEEWDAETALMKSLGFDTLILLRQALGRWAAYDSAVLRKTEGCFKPSFDYMDLFLTLAEKHGMRLFVPTYSPWHDWLLPSYDPKKEFELFKALADETWARYGHRKAFAGWYFAQEISGADSYRVCELFQLLGPYCKSISGNLPVMISPGMRGIKALPENWDTETKLAHIIKPAEHRKQWDYLMGMIEGCVDIIAFQDGHVEFEELEEYLEINVDLAHRHHLECWSNVESFDRDINPKFQPIAWEKLLFKLEAANRAKHDKLITYEFVPFLSPNGCYPVSKHLLKRYREWCAQA